MNLLSGFLQLSLVRNRCAMVDGIGEFSVQNRKIQPYYDLLAAIL